MESGRYELKINIAEALRYMGYNCACTDEALKEMVEAARLVYESAEPRVIVKELQICSVSGEVSFKSSALKLEGKSVCALLNSSDACVLFCATIGDEIEALLRRWQIKDMAAAAMLDACAGSAVEGLCDAAEKNLREEYAKRGLFLTDRFSPGYGDLPISVQKDFCAELDTARKIGVHVSADGIMIPRKSVTALMGISKDPQKSRKNGCENCRLINNCKFRESKVTCYGQAL